MLYYVDFEDFMTKCEFSFVHFISIREFKRTFLFKKSYKQSSLKMIVYCPPNLKGENVYLAAM